MTDLELADDPRDLVLKKQIEAEIQGIPYTWTVSIIDRILTSVTINNRFEQWDIDALRVYLPESVWSVIDESVVRLIRVLKKVETPISLKAKENPLSDEDI